MRYNVANEGRLSQKDALMPKSSTPLPLRTILLALAIVLLQAGFAVAPPPALSDGPQSNCRQNACAADCVAYQFALGHRNLEVFSRWYDTAYTITGCDDPDWLTNALFLLDIAAEVVGAPGGYTMDCREMALGQYSVCSNQCEANACRYAPNVRTTLDSCGQGALTATFDNARGETLPEYQPTAYARPFNSTAWLTGPTGTRLLLARQEVPALSYPNWITTGNAVASCQAQFTDTRCGILEMFDIPSEHSFDVPWGSGLYDLWGLMGSNSGMDSAPGDDHIRLNSDGDSITIEQGLVSGFVYERWRTKSGWGNWSGWSESVSAWNAYGGDQTITNHESMAWHDWNMTDRDSYVFATEGPSDDLLIGSYTIEVQADIAHDKDTSDNAASCAFDVSAPPPPPPTATPTPPAQATTTPAIRDIDVGTLHDGLESHDAEDLYRLQVPAGLTAVRVTLSGLAQATDLDLEMTRDLPGLAGTLVCSSARGGNSDEFCVLNSPSASVYYVHVFSYLGQGPYTLTVAFDQSTPTPSPTPTLHATVTPTPLPYNGQTESEGNDTRGAANPWDAAQVMRGQIGAPNDADLLFLGGAHARHLHCHLERGGRRDRSRPHDLP